MKRSLAVIALFLSVATQLKAQKEVLFKMKVNPNRNYAMLMNMNMNMEMNVEGDTAMINKIKKSGQTFPMVMTIATTTSANIKTRALAADKIPFTMTMQSQSGKMTINGKENTMPVPVSNENIYGFYTTDGKMDIDSIAGKKVNAALKENMIKLMEGIQAKVKFPDKLMKVGDTFTQSMPIDIPIAGFSAKMNNTITYKLTAIENNKAHFDLKYDMVSDMSGQQISITMTGGGDGKFVYDIPASYGVDMISNMNINYSLSMPQAPAVKMNGKLKMLVNYKTTITKN
jgi:hypothetical protein